jgi:replicative DNA helicase
VIEVTVVDVALFYAERGWRVFPCWPREKKPLVDHWDVEATTEKNKILGWWEFNPEANVGVATGKSSGIFVLDVDGPDGEQTLSKLIAEHGNLPITPFVFTGKGRQFFFSYPEGHSLRNTAKRLGAGLDTRGDGGYVVAPPSVHPNGKVYQWQKDFLPSKTPLALPPDWLIKLLEQPQEAGPVEKAGMNVFVTGSRNSALTSLAGSMRRKGFDFEAILAALLAENKNKCVPPLAEKEVRQIAESVVRYGSPAAPLMESRDRVTAEWSFARSVYLVPDYVKEFLWLAPEQFGDEKLAKFWDAVLREVDVVTAATRAGVLTDLEKYECDVFKVDGYARQIVQFAYMNKVKRLGYQLQKEAEIGDVSRIDYVVNQITKEIPPTNSSTVSIADVAEELDAEIAERAKNPVDVWGIPYSPAYEQLKKLQWNALSKLTGGKHLGELILLAGEPGIGKSWWADQDALFTGISGVPVFIWSGEMNRKQVLRRMYQLLGVNGRNMKTGNMTDEDWQMLAEAKALVLNSPIYIDDTPGIALHELRSRLYRERVEHGIQHFVVDYAYLVGASGKDETERTAIVSRELKIVCQEGDGMSGLLIASVNKGGMDTAQDAVKSNIRGSGQQLHDADIIYSLTKFAPISNDPVSLRYLPKDYDRLVTLHINKGRELDEHIPGGKLHFSRVGKTPAFQEELSQ